MSLQLQTPAQVFDTDNGHRRLRYRKPASVDLLFLPALRLGRYRFAGSEADKSRENCRTYDFRYIDFLEAGFSHCVLCKVVLMSDRPSRAFPSRINGCLKQETSLALEIE